MSSIMIRTTFGLRPACSAARCAVTSERGVPHATTMMSAVQRCRDCINRLPGTTLACANTKTQQQAALQLVASRLESDADADQPARPDSALSATAGVRVAITRI